MPNSDSNFAGSIPAHYDRCLGPLQFEPYAVDLATRIASLSPRSVLETAAGTGIVTSELAKRLAPGATINATDLNQPLLDVAGSKIANPNVIWRQANAVALPFADEEFDSVACQFGVMFFPDKLKAFQEARRVLKPGGHYIFNVWDRLELNEFSDVAAQAVAAFFPDNPSDFIRRVPFGYFDVDAISANLKEAAFPLSATNVLPNSPARQALMTLHSGSAKARRRATKSRPATQTHFKRSRLQCRQPWNSASAPGGLRAKPRRLCSPRCFEGIVPPPDQARSASAFFGGGGARRDKIF
jgi:ubiquinone/menaquinone biosynthesis C-methylase UbiE